jgi:hypothetical protein
LAAKGGNAVLTFSLVLSFCIKTFGLVPGGGISFFLQLKKETKNADAAKSLRVCFRSQGKQTNSSFLAETQTAFLSIACSSVLFPQFF